MKKRLKVCIIIIVSILVLTISLIEYKGKIVNKEIKTFTERGEFVCVENKIAYYKVLKKYAYEDAKNVINDIADIYVGTTGDIYVSAKDPLDFFVTKYISKRLRIGHGAIVKSDDAKTTVEVTGNSGRDNNVVKEYDNVWFSKSNTEITVLRVKNIGEKEKSQIKDSLEKKYGMPYSYNYFKHSENKYYCFDLCSEVYKEIGYVIDKGANTTLGSTMICDDDTYIIYYKKKVNKTNINYEVYFLSEE